MGRRQRKQPYVEQPWDEWTAQNGDAYENPVKRVRTENWFMNPADKNHTVEAGSKPFVIPEESDPEDNFFESQLASLDWQPAKAARPKSAAKPSMEKNSRGIWVPKNHQGDEYIGTYVDVQSDADLQTAREPSAPAASSASGSQGPPPTSASAPSQNAEDTESEKNELVVLFQLAEVQAEYNKSDLDVKEEWVRRLCQSLDSGNPYAMLAAIRRLGNEDLTNRAERAIEKHDWETPDIPPEAREGMSYHRYYHWAGSKDPDLQAIPAFSPDRYCQMIQGRPVSVLGHDYKVQCPRHPPLPPISVSRHKPVGLFFKAPNAPNAPISIPLPGEM